MDGSDRIGSTLYIRTYILAVRTYWYITGKSLSKYMEHIKEIIAGFRAFKEESRGIKITCNTIQTSISLWNDFLIKRKKLLQKVQLFGRKLLNHLGRNGRQFPFSDVKEDAKHLI